MSTYIFHFIQPLNVSYNGPMRTGKRDLTRINLRLTEEQAKRFSRVVEIAEQKTLGYAPLSDIVKELIGLAPYRLLNESARKLLEKGLEKK